MPCIHRFHRELLPKHPVKVLLIGTFNPIWDVAKGDNPDYFYSRNANLFWCILPHALGKNCLIDKSRKDKEDFCIDNEIGLSDLIYCIENVNEIDTNSRFLKKGFKDEAFEEITSGKYILDITFFTEELKRYIEQNRDVLKGVILTRKTKKSIPRIWQQWLALKTHCSQLGISVAELSSPSPRGGGIRDKITEWRNCINGL